MTMQSGHLRDRHQKLDIFCLPISGSPQLFPRSLSSIERWNSSWSFDLDLSLCTGMWRESLRLGQEYDASLWHLICSGVVHQSAPGKHAKRHSSNWIGKDITGRSNRTRTLNVAKWGYAGAYSNHEMKYLLMTSGTMCPGGDTKTREGTHQVIPVTLKY